MTRTTITLTPEADSLVRRVMRERGLSFKDAVNAAIVDGLAPRERRVRFETPTFDLGEALLPLDHALALAGELEDEALLSKRDIGK
ncbi:hypothetical protein BHE97_05715 [Aeromicrobium sp. PE09-221]|uniref:hypothetical protein n=1 Tax=Aeromicrobium sp. PE09-221 TaxID=1898043 RepID=UPI000B3ECA65|nr:hypothetical protein [Aeromicrobium sp. PE09-221]OUZ11332.1 hypothetical protein BHE97_05715 [Aeromicrobium sp. PE09-221]